MKKIMIVDDMETANFIMKKIIGKVSADHIVYDYTLPEKALAEAKDINPDMIFLDLNMPVIDGWQFLDNLQENNLNLPVYILTSSTSELDLQKSKKYLQVRDFLIKPMSVAKLSTVFQSIPDRQLQVAG